MNKLNQAPYLGFLIQASPDYCEDPLKRIVIFPLDYDYLI